MLVINKQIGGFDVSVHHTCGMDKIQSTKQIISHLNQGRIGDFQLLLAENLSKIGGHNLKNKEHVEFVKLHLVYKFW